MEKPQDRRTGPALQFLLEEGILRSFPNTELNGHPAPAGQRLANTANLTLHGIESEALLILLDKEGICASSGSACLADSDEPSPVIKAMKPDSTASRQMIRLSLDVEHSAVALKTMLAILGEAVAALRYQIRPVPLRLGVH